MKKFTGGACTFGDISETFDELKVLAKTPYLKYDVMRRAAIFSALTGMGFAELEKLTWREIQHSKESGYFIRFSRKKTEGLNTLPIGEQAFELLNERCGDTTKVFSELFYHKVCYHVPLWLAQAEIKRRITFHGFRHTFATLQLTFGTDLYTVQKLLGHKNIQTTQIYAKIIDQKKQEAVNKINLK